MQYKVCILAAGTGSRLSYSKEINKALLPVGGMSVLSRIIQKFSFDIEIVIAVGDKAEQVKDFVSLAYPKCNITFVDVDKWQGEGSGPGYSLMACREQLQCPFIFTACDTIVTESVPLPDHNWMGVAMVRDSENFLMAEVDKGRICQLHDKVNMGRLISTVGSADILKSAFIGMAGIFDWRDFWQSLDERRNKLVAGELQVANGLQALLEKSMLPVSFTWFDTGNDSNYEEANKVFSAGWSWVKKDGEFIYFEDDRVIKFFSDENVTARRVSRARVLQGIVPEIVGQAGGFYAYKKVEGEMLSEKVDRQTFEQFLDYCFSRLWQNLELSKKEEKEFSQVCLAFYKDKTEQRVRRFFEKTGLKDQQGAINGVVIPSLAELLGGVKWDRLAEGVPVLFHGDTQPENIIVKSGGGFSLLDWRQDFGGLLGYGDLYYDLAKLHHALLISHEVVRNEQFKVDIKEREASFSFLVRSNLLEFKSILESRVQTEGYDLDKVILLSNLIYLNIAALHHSPYDKLLYYLGKYMLYDDMVQGNKYINQAGLKKNELSHSRVGINNKA